MEAKELRIGNYFQDREGRLCQVEEISKDIDDCRIVSVNGALTSLPVKPIPLTEDWLLKFGFEWKNHGLRYNGITIHIHQTPTFYYSNAGKDHYVMINHVHQLQNLVYALTGEELKPK